MLMKHRRNTGKTLVRDFPHCVLQISKNICMLFLISAVFLMFKYDASWTPGPTDSGVTLPHLSKSVLISW